MRQTPKFYGGQVSLNVLVGSLDNAKACYEATEGHVVLGMLSKDYVTDEAAILAMSRYANAVDNAISIGLGAGDPNQSQMVTRLAKVLKPQHVNQVFTGVGASREAVGSPEPFINALISPTGTVGMVHISTGALSSQAPSGQVPVTTAIAMLKDMGADSVKYFNMKGLTYREEYEAVAKACAKAGFGLEPTGGIDLANFKEILQIAVDAGVPKIIPHVYTSIIDAETGETSVEDVKTLYAMMKEVMVRA